MGRHVVRLSEQRPAPDVRVSRSARYPLGRKRQRVLGIVHGRSTLLQGTMSVVWVNSVSRYVLEVAAGQAERFGIRIDDQLEFFIDVNPG